MLARGALTGRTGVSPVPWTVHVRPMQAVLEQAAGICRECGVVTAISPDTTAKTLVSGYTDTGAEPNPFYTLTTSYVSYVSAD